MAAAATDKKWQDTVAKAQVAAKAEKPTSPSASKVSPQKKSEKLSKVSLISATTWDVFSPPPSTSFKGKVVPRAVNRFSNPRKLSIEVHKVTPLTQETDSGGKTTLSHPFEECVIRLLVPANKQKSLEAKKEAIHKIRNHEGSIETFAPENEIDLDDEDDDNDDASVTPEQVSSFVKRTGGVIVDTGGKHFDGWKPRYRIPIGAATVESRHKTSVHVLLRIQDLKQEREFIFDTLEDANKFSAKLDEERHNEIARSKARLASTLGDIKLAPFERVSLLFEIISGWDLPVGDFKTSDPYVVCLLGRREVHRTKHIPATLDPIWTVKTGSLFLLEVAAEELFIEDGIKFLVKDFDQFGGDEALGLVIVPPRTIYEAKGERMEFKLQPVPGQAVDELPGYLGIRCRRASAQDISFMQGLEAGSGKAVAAHKMPKVANNALKSIVSKTKKIDDGVQKYKARPCPDPKRKEETEWMTKQEIEEEVNKPSHFWTDAGSGKLGRIFLEILSAEGLPNMDTGSWLGNLTDSFISIVFEDSFLRTDVIADCLDPVWLPWSQRAFILNIGHASSQVFLGVFDFDAGLGQHDLIGRVSVDITNLRPDTEYLLSYNIYPSAIVSGRDVQGKINIRLRMEIPDERKLALSVLEPPAQTYVNVKKGKDFRVVRQTCLGKVDVDLYSLNTLKSYVDELSEYQIIQLYIEDALFTLLLWRGHFPLKLAGMEILLPTHSITAFILAIVLVENPQYFPSFCFGSIAWLMFAVTSWRQNSPNEWSRCHSFADIMEKVIVGKCSTSPHNIQPFQGLDAAKVAFETWTKRVKESEEKGQRATIQAKKEEEERQKELEEIGEADGDLGTKVGGGIAFDPIKSTLYPVQLQVGGFCRTLRFIKHVLTWEEAYFSFWITIGSTFLAICCMFVPWFFLMRWTARIIVWVLFGPWMKLVDVFYVSKLKPETEEERIIREEIEMEERRHATTQAANQARQVRENAAKMRDMKKFMFGKFAMKVPILKEHRYSDRPLPQSSATPHKQKALSLAELAMQEAGYNRIRVPGQTLVGDMIPLLETDTFTLAPTGKATASPEKLARNTPGGGTRQNSESTATAYAHIGSLVAVAAVITFFGVPILASYSEFAVGMVQQLHSESSNGSELDAL